MKKLLSTLQFFIIVIGLNGQTIIEGNFKLMDGWSTEIYLLAITNYNDVFSSTNKYNIDTAIVDTKGDFLFHLENIPCIDCLYRIDVRPQDSNGAFIHSGTSEENFALFELDENQKIVINGNANQLTKSFVMEGAPSNWSYQAIRKLREPIYQLGDHVSQQFTNPEFLAGKNIDSLKEVFVNQLIEVSEENNLILLDHMNASMNIYDKIIGAKLYDYDTKVENDLPIYERMSSQVQETYHDHPCLKQLTKRIYDTKYVLPPGSVTPALNLPDTTGVSIELKNIGENLILIDFWASWCAPCRHENKATVKPLFDEFKSKGFLVYSVSMDSKEKNWKKAIRKDEMDWVNVSDLLGNDSPVYSKYKIEGLPTTYLIEKDGLKILAKNIRGDELKEFVRNYYLE